MRLRRWRLGLRVQALEFQLCGVVRDDRLAVAR
jgi:hypothetical protein